MSDSITIQNSDGETFAEVIDVIGVSEVKKAFHKSIKEGSLHKWFKGSKSKDGKPGWVNVVTGGTCASDEKGEGTPKCVSSSKRASMTKAERLSASRRKKKADPGQQAKSGAAKPTYVSTDKKKKMNEQIKRDEYGDPIGGPKISKKQKAKNLAANTPDEQHNTRMGESTEITEADKKGKGSGKKDACYHKVKSRYSVWPSAYASGALVKCRKKGAANWGNKSEEYIPEEGYDIARDQGRVRPSKDKKDATSYPVSAEMRKTQKVNKGPSAYERVKKKYSGRIMDVSVKKTTKEEVELVETPKVDQKLRKDAKPLKPGGLYKTGRTKEQMGDRAVMARRNLRNAMSRGGVGSMTPAKETAERREKHKAARGVKKEEYSDWREELEYIEEMGLSHAIKYAGKEGVKQIAKRGAKRAAKRAAIKVAGKSGGKAAKKAGEVAARETKKAAAETAAAVGQGAAKGLKKRKENFVAKVKRKSEEMVSGEGKKESKKKLKNVNEGKNGRFGGGVSGDGYIGNPKWKIKNPLTQIKQTIDNTAADAGSAGGTEFGNKAGSKIQTSIERGAENATKTAVAGSEKISDNLSKGLSKGVGKAALYTGAAVVGTKLASKAIDRVLPDKKKKKKKTVKEGAAWTKKSGKNPSGGLNEKGRKSYERENPGSDLKAPSKKVGNKRRSSFCARMKGMKKKLTSAKTARDPDSRINKSLRAWNC